jgi:hypothetical protein
MRDSLPQVFQFRRNMRLCGVIGVLLIAEACSPAFADEIIHYASTCLEQESGDVAGYVVLVSDREPLPSISFSWSEGALMLPVAAKVTDYDRMSGRLAFSVHTEGGDFHFKGEIGSHRIQGILMVPWEGSPPEHVELEVRSRKAAFEPDAECR